ncbi:hypothetical protein [Methylobacterium radiodurans]|uniref:Uncharacterized protein n=1 Tax=Methylobacterium radiodurans TaxID=2202828 RepID=A0A2U8VQX5_9HYPH|nr:hypothetical protein [Methylobacterium radiodurans]AWN35878.1 hypothetical protein DK427_09105 [Methylobacterium radiodurans]
MPDLSRSQFCEITCLSPDALKSLTRRGQIPFMVDQKASGRGYTLFEAFLMILANEFVEGHGVNLTRAAEIAAAVPAVLEPEWSRVVETAEKLFERDGAGVDPIMCGRCQSAGPERAEPICGTHDEIAQKLKASGKMNARLTLSSASHALATLIRRALNNQIEIPEEFWSTPFSFRERARTDWAGITNMKKLIAEGEHLKHDAES